MSKIYNIKGNTIFAINDDGSVTTIGTIDDHGEITPSNRPPYHSLEMRFRHAEHEGFVLRERLSKSEEEIKMLNQKLQVEIKNKEAKEAELKRITPIASELTWRKGVNDKLSDISSSINYTRNTARCISSDIDDSSKWMKLLLGGSLILLMVVIAVLFIYTGSVKGLNNSSTLGDELIDKLEQDSITMNQTKATQKEVDLTKLPLIIKDVTIANVEKDGTVISDYGKSIDSQKTKYLNPQITYFGIKSGTTTLRIKWIRPDGSISTGSSSIGDFSQIDGYSLSVGKNDKLILNSWGNDVAGNYWGKGDYFIEIWYDDIMLIRKPFTID